EVPRVTMTVPPVQTTDQAALAADETATETETEPATATPSTSTTTTREPNAAQIAGLCNAWQAHAMHAGDRGKWMDATAFRTLASVAAGSASTGDEDADTTEATDNTGTTETTDNSDTADATEQDVVNAYCDELIGPRTSVTGASPAE